MILVIWMLFVYGLMMNGGNARLGREPPDISVLDVGYRLVLAIHPSDILARYVSLNKDIIVFLGYNRDVLSPRALRCAVDSSKVERYP